MSQVVIPVVYSTLSPNAIASRLPSQYKIEEVTKCQFWNRGLSDVYLVETKTNRYIFRISHHHWRSKSDIYFELELLDFLKQRHLPVAYPLRTTDGHLSVEIDAPEGKRYGTLFIYAPGEIALGDFNPTQSRKLGETLAKIHQAATDFDSNYIRQPLTLEYLLDNSLVAIAPLLKHRKTDHDYLIGVICQIKDQLQDFPTEPPIWGICWGDPHSGNVHFTHDLQLTLFDFDQCGFGWRAFDLAKFLQVSLRAGIGRNVRDAFLEGYQTVQQITDYEIKSLQAFTQAAHIWVWAININAACIHNSSRLDDSYLTQRLERLKRLTSHDWQLF